MELHELANLVMEVAEELKGDSRAGRAGRECGLTEAELVFQGPTGDYAGAVMFQGAGDTINHERTLEEAADTFARFLGTIYSWSSLARRHGLLAVSVVAKRFSGATTRDLYVQEEPSTIIIPNDPWLPPMI